MLYGETPRYKEDGGHVVGDDVYTPVSAVCVRQVSYAMFLAAFVLCARDYCCEG